MTDRQLVFDIAPTPSFAAEDYVSGTANLAALELVQGLAWPTPVGILIGEPGSGKTHLAHVFADRWERVVWSEADNIPDLQTPAGPAQAVVLDGLESRVGGNEDAVFHTLEAARASQCPVLVTSTKAPEMLGLSRPDTVSRLRAGVRASIEMPDQGLFLAIAVKQFTDRQLMVDPAVADYLLQRMERSYANLQRLIALIDEQSLAAGRSITKPLARDVLAAYEGTD